ncbi:MAG: zinc ribbon domain-containing protein [Acidobacteriota bacterium]
MTMTEFKLVAGCAECARQYDVTGQLPGNRFHCSCGAIVTVPTPQPHESAAIHCSSCGGPRQDGAESCAFCGADFTIHELDLSALCPHCMTRLSRRAKYCHSCAHPMTATRAESTPTEVPCPSCPSEEDGRRLRSRRVGRLAILECARCAGIWLERDVFERLGRQARGGHVPTSISDTSVGSASGTVTSPVDARPEDVPMYRPCPICGKLMNRQNYGRRSGVIVDLCKEHGLWFDADELDRILGWIKDGGLDRAERQTVAAAREAQRQRPPVAAVPMESFGRYQRPLLVEAISWAVDWVIDLRR